MAIRCRPSDSDNIAPELEKRKIVYVDTSLDTCLGITISESVTVSDLKKKMVMEHMQLYPEHGEMMVHRVKVKRRGKFYALPDKTIVCDMIPRGNRCEFLSADCSSTSSNYLKPKSPEHGESGSLRVELGRTSDEYHGVLSCDVNKEQTPVLSLRHGGDLENGFISEMIDGSKLKNYTEKKLDFECSGDSAGHSRARKKLKIALNGCIHQSQCFEGNDSILCENAKDKSMVDSCREVPEGISVHNQVEKLLAEANDEVLIAPNVARGIDVESNKSLENHLAFDSRKEDILLENVVPQIITAYKSDNELGQNAQVKNLEGIMREPDLSVGSVDKSDKTRTVKSSNKKKRKRGKGVEGTHITTTENSNSENVVNSQDALHIDRRNDGVMLQNGTSDKVLAGISEKEHGQSDRVDCEEVVTVKELNLSAIDNSGAGQEAIFNGNQMIKMISIPAPEESVVDSQYRSALDKTKKDTVLRDGTPEFMTRESDYELGQIHPAEHLEDITIITGTMEGGKSTGSKKKRKKKAQKEVGEIQNTSNLQHEIGKALSVHPNTETLELGKAKESLLSLNGDEVLRSSGIKTSDVSPNLLEENVSTSRKKRKKGKKSAGTNLESGSAVVIHSAINHVLEETGKDLPSNFVDSSAGDGNEKIQNADEDMEIFIATLIEDEEVIVKKNQTYTDVNSDSTFVVKDNLELNQIEDSDKNTENKVEKTKKKRKKIVNLSLNVEANLPGKDLKADADVLATKENLTSINFFKNAGKVQTANAGEEVNYVPGQSNHRGSVLDSGSAFKGSSAGRTQEKLTIKKPNEPVPVSSYVGGTNKHLDKSSSERSDMFPENARGKRRQTDLGEKVKLVMRPPQSKSLLLKLAGISQDKKTTQKKSLLAKAGSIFKDHSDEESTDENGKIFSDANTGSSESSSDSDEDNEHNDGKAGSNGGKDKLRFDLSTVDGMTIDKLLRSSSQYKKAKLQASQSELDQDESQPIDSVPYILSNP